jgi:hypothetical protein
MRTYRCPAPGCPFAFGTLDAAQAHFDALHEQWPCTTLVGVLSAGTVRAVIEVDYDALSDDERELVDAVVEAVTILNDAGS